MNELRKFPIDTIGQPTTRLDLSRIPEIEARELLHETRRTYRSLTEDERHTLIDNGNTTSDWSTILVADGFDPRLVHRCTFYGLVRIGALSSAYLQYHDLTLPIGIADSMIIACDIGDDCVVRHVQYLSRYVIGNEVVLFNIDEMGTSDYAKFGNGVLRDGEDEQVRVYLEIANENAGRKIIPFDGIVTGDAYLWSRYRTDELLQDAFLRMTDDAQESSRGVFGSIGTQSVIKSCRVIKDVRVGSHAYIKGANKLKNLTIKSRKNAASQIGEGVELVNGIIEYGCRIFYGVKAVRFVMRTNTCLKYGARLINSILGDNGTISCCEVLNSLVFPGHEQHHNNSFLCAATLLGQSNIAAAATIGSNHNSRANDGELVAGRGFWPGLSVNLKHPTKLASFCLIAKGSYPAELDIPLPFTLVSNATDRLILKPCYWFHFNMYALARNSWKYADRDAHLYEHQEFEYEFLAPDTVEEISRSMELMEQWAGLSLTSESSSDRYFEITLPSGSHAGVPPMHPSRAALIAKGKEYLSNEETDSNRIESLTLHAAGIERSSRPVEVRDFSRAYRTYRGMATLYAVRSIIALLDSSDAAAEEILLRIGDESSLSFCNVGGQLIRSDRLDALLEDIRTSRVETWLEVHKRYELVAGHYAMDRGKHALSIMKNLFGKFDDSTWNEAKKAAISTQKNIAAATRESREKDYLDPFRRMMYESEDEMNAVMGRLEDNSFISLVDKQTEEILRPPGVALTAATYV